MSSSLLAQSRTPIEGCSCGFRTSGSSASRSKRKLAQVLRLEAVNLQLNCDQSIQAPVKEQEVKRKIPAAHLNRHLRSHVAEVASQLRKESLKLLKESAMQVCLCVAGLQIKELQDTAIFEGG